jgi:hypothetical protein
MALVRKAPSLLALGPDIAIIPECSKKSLDAFSSHGFSSLWFGANSNKGIGCLLPDGVRAASGGQTLRQMGGSRSDSWRSSGFHLLAVCACPVGTKLSGGMIVAHQESMKAVGLRGAAWGCQCVC